MSIVRVSLSSAVGEIPGRVLESWCGEVRATHARILDAELIPDNSLRLKLQVYQTCNDGILTPHPRPFEDERVYTNVTVDRVTRHGYEIVAKRDGNEENFWVIPEASLAAA
jgi:hypothetical protein